MESRYGFKVVPGMVVFEWLVEYSAVLLNLFRVGGDGKTAWRRLRDRPWRIPLHIFGEQVSFRLRSPSKLESRWQTGVYLGIREHTTEKVAGTSDGIYVVQNIRRNPDHRQANGDLLRSVKGTPSDPQARSVRTPGPLPEVIPIETQVARPIPLQQPEIHHRFYITRAELQRFGYSKGCHARDVLRAGAGRSGVQHDERRRKRIEECIKEAGDHSRYQAHQEREREGEPRESEDTIQQETMIDVPEVASGSADRRFRRTGEELFKQLKRLDPEVRKQDYFGTKRQAEWDVEDLEQDIATYEGQLEIYRPTTTAIAVPMEQASSGSSSSSSGIPAEVEGETRKRAISDSEHDDEAAPKTYRIHDGEDVDLLMEAAPWSCPANVDIPGTRLVFWRCQCMVAATRRQIGNVKFCARSAPE